MKPFAPQLSMPVNPKRLDKYVADDNFWLEQKLDGVRLVIECDDGTVIGWNRRGNQITLTPRLVDVLKTLNGRWLFDCEWIDNVAWCFDIPELKVKSEVVTIASVYSERRDALETTGPILEKHTNGAFRVLPTHRTLAEKTEIVAWCRDHHAEGVMVKDRNARYWPGKRSPHCMKAKFTETGEVIVTEVGRGGKRSIAIGAYSDGILIDMGACTVSDRQLAQLEVGMIVEVRYLYCTKDDRLYQPAFLKIRTDKHSEECVLEQFKHTSREVHA